jgi:PhnB protein
MGNRVGHAELQIGDSVVMLADEFPDMGHLGPKSRGGPTSSILLYVDDVDTAFNKAINAGATQQRALENQFWGDRMGTLQDPFGHQWSLASHVEDVSQEDMQKRMEQFSSQKQPEPA